MVHYAWHFEDELERFLTTYNEVASDSTTVEDLGSERSMEQSLIRIMQSVTTDRPSTWKLFRTTLKEQRFLLHSFLTEREAKLQADDECQELIAGLPRVEHNLRRSRVALNSMRAAIL